ncbi:MAG TPA: site-2 protease family protein [Ktedonobacterales bacterium]|nr:site-2 protease family protein [Ktedonobacterales bacterium]
MAQPDGIPHNPGVATPIPASGGPESRPPTLRLSPSAAPSAAPARHEYQRRYSWRGPTGWLLSVASAVASFLAAAVLFRSITISLVLLALIFVHEMGHVVALKVKRIPVSAPIFIPLVGAFVIPGQIRRARDMAIIALAGPFAGGLGALACLVVSLRIGATDCLAPVFSGVPMNEPCFSYRAGLSYSWLVLAYVGFFFNLVNLLPLFPLDGGRVAATISRWLWPLGILLSLALLLLDPEPLTWMLALTAIVLTVWAFIQREPLAPIQASTGAKIGIAVAYIGLALLLAAGMLLTQEYLHVMQLTHFRYYPYSP